MLRKVTSILDLVGATPLVRLNRVNPIDGVEIYAKVEFFNPGGSVKDRPALRMIEAAEASGELTKDKIVLEATSGNTGIGLAMVCAVKGYRMLFTMSESASEERRRILRAYGAEILTTPARLSTDGAIEEAYRLARENPDKYFLVDQFNNDDNWRAHYERGTGDEIYEATEGKVDVVVGTLGTAGTVMGMSRRLHELDEEIRVVAVEPYQGHKIQGLKNMTESYAPGIFDPGVPDEIVHVEDDQAYEMCRRLAREEGIFVGMSSGAAVVAAIEQARRLGAGTVVTMLPDGGERYLSTSLFVSEVSPVPLKLYNTATRNLDELTPIRPGQVGIYACGPSLDGPPDLGLCRRMVFADLVRRYLEYRGFDVKLVVNIGDIDDRTVGQCLSEGAQIDEFTARWEHAFFENMDTLAVERAHQYPKASQHVPEMIEVASKLLQKGYAYEKLRSVYFDISKVDGYGRLAGVNVESVKCGKTVDFDYYEKDNPRDFTLFKRATLAELKAGIYWKTPWGSVRPGWHVECATMASSELGRPFDLHLASADLVFPHGDNEIAIAECLSDEPFANMWLHSEVVVSDAGKVSRVHGNDVTLKDLLQRGHSPAAVRFWLLSQHYRRVLRYDERQLEQAEKTVARLDEFVARLRAASPGEPDPSVAQHLYEVRYGVQEAMDNDLNVPRAKAHLFAFVKRINRLINAGRLSQEQIDAVLDAMARINDVLAVIDLSPKADDSAIETLVRERTEARARGDFAAADRIRDELSGKGVQLFDGPAGTRWRRTRDTP